LMEVWLAGNVTSNTHLIGACIPRVACDFERLASNQPFLQHVGVDQIQLLLQSPWICDGNETVKFKALCTWLRVSTVNSELTKRDRHFKHLLELINMNRLSKESVIEASVGGLDFNLTKNARWRKLPRMPTPRSATGAAHIPGVGDIVVGGYTGTTHDINIAEIFLTASSPLGHAGSWCEITPMLHSRVSPSAEFFNGKVYVAGNLTSVEMLSLFPEGPSQWTEVINTTFQPRSIISFNGSLLFGCEFSLLITVLF
uniref:BACK domain-containing protein n=1 Tax=Rodentolepis nana TaxID=102285 RepID=A0A0R3TUV3_RODNA